MDGRVHRAYWLPWQPQRVIVFRMPLSWFAPACAFGLGVAALCSVRGSMAADGAQTGAAGAGTPAGAVSAAAGPAASIDAGRGAAGPAGRGATAAGPTAAVDAGAGRPLTEGLGRAYLQACERGNAQYASRDFASAVASYRAAISQAPHASLGYYWLGEAQLASGDFADAEASWRRALSESERDPAMHARILFVMADLKERQKLWDEAKIAWQAYRDWLTQFPAAGGFATSAEARREAIERMLLQERAAAVVRRRIQETADGGVFSSVPGEPVSP